MYTIKGHRRMMATTGAGVAGVLAVFVLCLLLAVVVLVAVGPMPAIFTAVVACATWYAVGLPHTSGPVLAMSRVVVFGLNSLVIFSAILKLLWG